MIENGMDEELTRSYRVSLFASAVVDAYGLKGRAAHDAREKIYWAHLNNEAFDWPAFNESAGQEIRRAEARTTLEGLGYTEDEIEETMRTYFGD